MGRALTSQPFVALAKPVIDTLVLHRVGFFSVAMLIVLCISKTEIEWKWAHIYFSYEYGFMKRGLIGEIFRLSHIPSDLDNFKVLSVLMLLGVVTLFFNLIKDTKVFLGFAALFLCSPLLLKNLVYDWGRFDQIAIMVVFLQLLWLDEKTKLRYLYLGSPLLVFMHEGTLLWTFPALLTIAYLEDRKVLLYLLPALGLSVISILLWGGLDVNPEQYLASLQSWAKPNTVHWAIIYTLTASIQDSIHYSVPALLINAQSERGYVAIALLALHSIPLVFYKNNQLILFNVTALVVACSLFLIANDHFRWIALMGMINLFFLIYAYKRNYLKDLNMLCAYLLVMSAIELFMAPVGVF